EWLADAVILATGHSARDTVAMLVRAGAAAVPRPVAIGARIEHPQELVDQARYGEARGDLPPSSYRLAWHPRVGAKARTFCMCPGGMVVPAMNAVDRVVVNGMSFAAQRGLWANSAVIVDVPVEVYGAPDPLAGFRWQDEIEARAFELGGGDYAAPAQRAADLLAGVVSSSLPKVSYPFGARPVDLRAVLPDVVLGAMVTALRRFERDIAGFAGPDGVLLAPETRTTSPVVFTRDDRGQSVSLPGLFPSGEGAGYGGGIVSCALDGARAARGVLASG
ncbi:MAG TPA: FAD-dependent oxidoreductase, partial [Myxococcota bacterium]|nr:FAD-dependent oxidoreductase [Myxococcota bacterium]